MKICQIYKKIDNKQIRFFICSFFVTGIDYFIFFLLLDTLGIVLSNFISYSFAIIISFYLQNKYVFSIGRSKNKAFIYVLIFSFIGVNLSSITLHLYSRIFNNVVTAKILMTITMFFYNFNTKKLAFRDR
jgi:putative flippase GtrA